MKQTIFTGSGVALVTPFLEDNSVNYKKLAELIEYHIEHRTDALIICGTTGEAATLSNEEHEQVLKFSVEQTKGRIPVIAGTGSNDTAYAIQLSQYAQSIGADGLLLVTPYYNKASQKGLIAHYTAIANSVTLPIILYNVPSRTGVNITPETLNVLADVPNIVAIKEASGDLGLAAKMMQLCGDRIDFYSGNDDIVVPLLSIGGIGVISVAANIIPEEVHDMCQLYLDGKVKEAAALQLKYLDLMNTLFCDVNPIPVKTAMNMLGFEVGPLKLPLCEMTPANIALLDKSLQNAGLK
ncbi:MAG: 4-hydroxy-tetrahydrodipicolinate synthase [Ruminococcaceae bacterium]|nr:4-hydroxy-tetrahydrodipicolinate synthase [Oscillospiraceae bacterium]